MPKTAFSSLSSCLPGEWLNGLFRLAKLWVAPWCSTQGRVRKVVAGDLVLQLQEGSTGIGPHRCASARSRVAAAGEGVCSLPGGARSSERCLWGHVSVVLGETPSPMEKTWSWTCVCLCRWQGQVWRAGALAPMTSRRVAPPREQVLKPGQRGSLFGNTLG